MQVIPHDKRHLEQWDEILPVLQEYADSLGVDINVYNPHGGMSRVEQDGLHIKFWSYPEEAGSTEGRRRAQAFGIKLNEGQPDGFAPTGIGRPITDPVGEVVAEIVGNTTVVLFDLPHGENAAELIRLILEQYAGNTTTITKQIEEEIDQTDLPPEDKIKAKYVQICGQRLRIVREDLQKDITQAKVEMQAISTRMVELNRRIDEKTYLLNNTGEAEQARLDWFALEYDKLMELPHVAKVEIEEGLVSIFTDTIYITNQGKTYELGDYRIDIRPNGKLKTYNLRVKELTGQTKYHHPHIFYEGESNDICLGNIRDGINKLIAKYEYSIVAEVMIEFLLTMTDESHYRSYLTYWKPITEKKEEKAA